MTVDASPAMHVDALLVDMVNDSDIDLGLERRDAETSSDRTVNQDTAFVGNLRRDGFDIGSAVSDGAPQTTHADAAIKESPTAPEAFQPEEPDVCGESVSFLVVVFAIAFGGRRLTQGQMRLWSIRLTRGVSPERVRLKQVLWNIKLGSEPKRLCRDLINSAAP